MRKRRVTRSMWTLSFRLLWGRLSRSVMTILGVTLGIALFSTITILGSTLQAGLYQPVAERPRHLRCRGQVA